MLDLSRRKFLVRAGLTLAAAPFILPRASLAGALRPLIVKPQITKDLWRITDITHEMTELYGQNRFPIIVVWGLTKLVAEKIDMGGRRKRVIEFSVAGPLNIEEGGFINIEGMGDTLTLPEPPAWGGPLFVSEEMLSLVKYERGDTFDDPYSYDEIRVLDKDAVIRDLQKK